MKRSIFIKVASALVNILAGLMVAIIVLFLQDWFGSGDLSVYIFWTIPIAVGFSISGKTILELFRIKHFVLRFLLIVVITSIVSFSWVYGLYLIIGPWINAFSIPVFYLWIIGSSFQLLFLDLLLLKPTEQSKTSEIMLRLLGFPLAVVCTVVVLFIGSTFSSYVTRPEPETFLIPRGYEGMARVVYGEECGIEPAYENDRRILKIPANGLLIIQPEFEAGIIDHEYYFVDEEENRDKATRIKLGSSGSMGGPMPDGSYSTESPSAINFTNFYVSRQSSGELSERAYTLENQRIDSLTKVLVAECRNEK